jgi:Ca-activated chloride channel family protein
LKYCLKNLNSDDRFNIITFSDNVWAFRNELVKARDQRKEGIRFAESISEGGGTNIYDALRRAVGMDWDDSRPRAIIFLTDGLPTVGTTDLEAILKMMENKNQQQVRVFPFGVGHDVDAIFLDRLAKNHRGATEYVEPKEDIETAVTSFYNRIQHPVLSDPELKFQGIEVDIVYPTDLPDLFAGNQLLVLGRFTGSGEHQIVLSGDINGREKSIKQTVDFPKEELNNEFIDKLWASRRIGFLLEAIRLHGENWELKDEVIALSKEYGIATPYTSFLVREDQPLAQIPRPANQPKRIDMGATSQTIPGLSADQEGQYHFRGGFSSETQPVIEGLSVVGSSNSKKVESIHASEVIRMLKEEDAVSEESMDSFKRIQGRNFEKHGEEWVETSFTDKDTAINIKYDSKAYWELLNELPDLSQVFALGEKVVLKVGKVYVKIGDAGREEIDKTEIRSWM